MLIIYIMFNKFGCAYFKSCIEHCISDSLWLVYDNVKVYPSFLNKIAYRSNIIDQILMGGAKPSGKLW